MDQEKFGNFIKEIRKKNNLTQKEFAKRYNVTYQAVSKWENGKNMPDISLIKKISEDYNISLEEMFDASKKRNKTFLYLAVILVLILFIIYLVLKSFNGDFNFKTITSNCDNFDITGSIAYNDSKSSIYITDIKYCGEVNQSKYKQVECILYESNNGLKKEISSYIYENKNDYSLSEILKDVTLYVDDYKKACKDYTNNSLILEIRATDFKNNIITYNVPLTLEDKCMN